LSQPGAKRNDRIVGVDTHFVVVPGPSVTPMQFPFDGRLSEDLSPSIFIDEQPAATRGSRAIGVPHVAPVGSFQRPPSNEATVRGGSSSVFFDGRPAARCGDSATTCNDPCDAERGTIVAAGTVLIGG
jgi:uncharacterized Zn-binding protein involved in type VI secretion